MLLTGLVNPAILGQPVYEPGKPIEDVARELGLDPASILKLASNENALGPSPRGVAAATAALGHAALYPDGGCVTLRAKLAARYGLDPSQFVIGNGSNELLELLGHVFLRPGDEVVMGNPAFIVYKLVALLFGAKPVEVPLVNHTHDLPALAAAITPRTKLVFVASPNNPTGTANPAADLLAFARTLPPHVVLVLDEAYAEFLEGAYRADIRPLIAEGRHVIGLRTFSKIYGLAALRVGYGYCSPELAGLLNRARQPFNVNAIGLAAAEAALDDRDFVERSLATNRAGLAQLEAGLRDLGRDLGFGFDIKTVPSHANFILARTGHGARVFAELQKHGVIIRPVAGYGLPDWIRITVGTGPQNDRLLRELATVLRSSPPSRLP